MMRLYKMIWLSIFIVAGFGSSNAQVRFYVNQPGGTPVDTINQGDQLFWQADCAPGATVHMGIWMDLDSSHTVSAGDTRLFLFDVTDGSSDMNEGPGDVDGLNGKITVTIGPFGFAPITWLITVQEGEGEQVGACTVRPMQNPPMTVSGTVTFNDGSSAKNVLVATDFDNDPPFWNAVTDENGHYTINVGLPAIYDIVPFLDDPAYLSPQPIMVDGTSQTEFQNVDFTIMAANCFVEGSFLDDSGSLVTGKNIGVSVRDDSDNDVAYGSFSDGQYRIGLQPGHYYLDVDRESVNPDYMVPMTWSDPNYDITVGAGETIDRDFTFFKTDTAIYAKVLQNGTAGIPAASMYANAMNDTTGELSATNDEAGYIRLAVRSGHQYSVQIDDRSIPTGFGCPEGLNRQNVSPGDTVEFNFVNYTSSVKVAFLLNETSPQPQWDRFSVWARNSQTEVNRQGLESGDAITFFIPNENLQVGLSGPRNYLAFPQYYDVVPGDSVAFNVKYARAKVTGKLHGFPGQLQNDGIFAHSAGDYPNFYSNWSQISSDSSYTLWVTDGEWYLNPPFVQGYNISALDTMIVVPDMDTTFTVDFYYSPVTGIDGKGEHVIKTFNLEQNYPNPFNPETTISFTIPDAGNVQLEVYNLLGEKVETVVNSWMNAGFHTVRWNASKFPSGLYFCRLSDLHHHAIKKMMLVK